MEPVGCYISHISFTLVVKSNENNMVANANKAVFLEGMGEQDFLNKCIRGGGDVINNVIKRGPLVVLL